MHLSREGHLSIQLLGTSLKTAMMSWHLGAAYDQN